MRFTFDANGDPDNTLYELGWKLQARPVDPAVPWHQTGTGWSWSNGNSMYSFSRIPAAQNVPSQLGSTGMYLPWYYGLIANTKYLNRTPPVSSAELDRLFCREGAVVDAYMDLDHNRSDHFMTTLTHTLETEKLDESDYYVWVGGQGWRWYHTVLQTSSQPSDTGAALVGIRRNPDGWRQQILEVFPSDALSGAAAQNVTPIVKTYLGARHYFDVFSIFPLLDLGGLSSFQPPESSDDSMQAFLEQVASLSVFYDFDPVTPWIWIPFHQDYYPVGSFRYGSLTFGPVAFGSGYLKLDTGKLSLPGRCRVTYSYPPTQL